MTEVQNVQVIQDAYAAFGRRDIAALLEMTAADVDWEFLGPQEIPTSGRRQGRAEVQRFFQDVEATWDFDRFEPRQFVAQGAVVVALGFYGGTAKATSRKFGCEWSHVFTIQNGKIAKFREYTDTFAMYNACAPSAVNAG